MRAKRTVLVGGLLFATVLGVAGGYFGGELTNPSSVLVSGVPAPLGGLTVSPSAKPTLKTPVKNDLKGLDPDNLDFNTQHFTVDLADAPAVQLSVRIPIGWEKKILDTGEVKFQDLRRTRWIRFKPVHPVKQNPKQRRDQLVPTLDTTIPYEQNFKLLGQSDDSTTGQDGQPRRVSTVTYSYIPDQWTRDVIVQYVATGGQAGADVEMAITGLPQDQDALDAIAAKAAETVTLQD
ncbi:hypothetical protein E1263_18890 [Kribbella antibiotica]|uniref:Uncharacterized protein n=1 Tax=Kribbella antibiotica TaxID=190195 RepID=A0A4R4ZNM2_9ACTN|nr:hypothetical protein [Kribbella antibiotica]TDD58492.1 hypothetical protein E1263_18890 [Kribbella antibiotica]